MKFFEKRPLPPAVPIVPMIDILTILLIFFIVNSQWKKPRNLLEIEIPSVTNLVGKEEVKERATLSVGTDSKIDLNGQSVDIAGLAVALVEFRKTHPGIDMEMEADRKIPLETLVKVWDALTEAGIDIKTVPARIEVEGAASPGNDREKE